MSRPCITKGCSESCSSRSKLPRCVNCSATINRWEYRRPGEILARQEFLVKSRDRMTQITGGKRHGRR